MKDSLRSQLIFFFTSMILSLFLITFFVYRFNMQYAASLQSLIERQQNFTELYGLLYEADSVFYQYAITPSEVYRDSCITYAGELLDKSALIQSEEQASWSNDLHALVQSYTSSVTEELLQTEDNYLSVYTSTRDWYLILTDNYQNYSDMFRESIQTTYQKIEQQQNIQVLIVGVLLVCNSVFELFIIRTFIRRLMEPIENLTQIASANMTGGGFQLVPVQGEGEIKVLCSAFNQMLSRIQEQMRQLKDQSRMEQDLHAAERRELEAQMKTLQSRINSHFLFNTLNVLTEMAWEEHAEHTSEALEQLAVYLRFSLDNLDKVIPLQREFDNVNDYFSILRLRFGDRFTMEAACSPACAQAAVPAMILQPMIENSYKHGVAFMSQGGRIQAKGTCDGQTVTIQVTDNGIGMDDETIRKLYGRIASGDACSDSNGIGLSNIVSRIRYKLNCEVTVNISSIPGEETKISLQFPYIPFKG